MNVIYFLDLFGSFVFAVSGAILAMRKKMDIFGVIVVGFVTAVGGGTFRDLLLGKAPVFWLHDKYYFLVVLGGTVGTFLFSASILKIENILRIADALGLGTFTIIGIEKGLESRLLPLFAIMMGIITASFGGAVRDVICQEIPLILSREIYATACLVGGLIYFFLRWTGLNHSITIAVSVFIIIAVRIISIKLNLSLPKNEDMKNKL